MKPTPEQEKDIIWWTYLTLGIGHTHALAWYRELFENEGREAAELFRKRVNYINRRAVL